MTRFNYKEMGGRDEELSLSQQVLQDRGIGDTYGLLMNTTQDMELDFHLLDNIKAGVALYLSELEIGSVMGLIVDCDNDGYASASIMYNYTKKIRPDIDIRIILHNGKTHGISHDIGIPEDVKFLVITDAGTNDIIQQKEQVALGRTILIIDHHNVEEKEFEEVENVVVINCQSSPKYPNKHISGSGMVYKFCQALDMALKVDFAKLYRDLAGMGCVADIMDSTEFDTRYLMNCAVDEKVIRNPFLKLLIQEKILKSGELNLTTLAWNVVPLINSTTRLGTMEEKQAVFNAFISTDEEELVLGMKKATSCKGRQDRLKKKALVECRKQIEEQGLSDSSLILLDVSEIYTDKGLNGVVSNGLSSEFNRPVILYGGDKEIVRGSARNCNEAMIDNFQKWCSDSGLFELAQGHNNAFGCEFNRENVEAIKQLANETIPLGQDSKLVLVERAIEFKDLCKQDVLGVAKLQKLWCTNIKEPVFLIKNVHINNSKMEKKGSKGNVMAFFVDGYSFVKLFLSKDFYSRVTMEGYKKFGSTNLEMDVLCKFKKNEYNGTITPQLEIIDIISEPVAEVTLDDIF